jgi:hypothetical protein
MSHFCPDGAGIGAKIACQTSRPPSSR